MVSSAKAIEEQSISYENTPDFIGKWVGSLVSMHWIKISEKVENILENAKQVGAKLFVLGETIMRQNPNLTGEELKELILQRASESNLRISPYQLRVLDRQAEIYDSLKLKRDKKIQWWFEEAGIVMPKDVTKIEELINSNKELNFIVWKSIFWDLYEKNRSRIVWLLTSPQMEYVDINMQGDAGKISQELAAREVKKWLTRDSLLGLLHKDDLIIQLESMTQVEIEEILYDIYIIQKGVEVNLNQHAPMIDITWWEFDINSYWWWFHGNRLWAFEYGSIFWLSTRSNKGHFQTETEYMKNIIEWKKTSEHEYQHFLNFNFLNPDMLASVFNKNISFSQKRIWRDIWTINPNEYQRRIWKSMQDELCSYLERDNHLPHNIDSYLDNFLKSEKSQIPGKFISEMQEAISFFSRLLNLPVEELRWRGKDIIWIIRTSYSIEDMLTRLQKKFPTLNNNS